MRILSKKINSKCYKMSSIPNQTKGHWCSSFFRCKSNLLHANMREVFGKHTKNWWVFLMLIYILTFIVMTGSSIYGDNKAKFEVIILEGLKGNEIPHRIKYNVKTFSNLEWEKISVNICNMNTKTVFLRVGIKCDALFKKKGNIQYWDGSFLFKSPKGILVNTEMLARFPLCCVFDDREAIAIGVEADTFYSYLKSEYNTEKHTIAMYTRLVLRNKERKNLRFILFRSKTQWGYNKIVDIYYDLYPEFFKPRKGIDPRTWNGLEVAGEIPRYWQFHPYPELFRRARVSWSWFYAPYKRSGDFYGHKQFWQNPSSTPDQKRAQEMKVNFLKTPEEWRKFRQNQFLKGKLANNAIMMYMTNACESYLAKTEYPDNIIYPLGNFPTLPRQETAWRIYPAGGKFEKRFLKDLELLAKENYMAGCAWDSVGGLGQRKYRNNLLWSLNLPVAFDEQGPYVLSGTGIAIIFDKLHNIPVLKGRYKMAVNPNATNGSVYYVRFRSNTTLHEGEIPMYHWDINKANKVYLRLMQRRYLAGQKSIFNHYNLRRDKFGSKIKWWNYPPEQIKLLYRAWFEHQNITCLYLGILPSPDSLWGIPEMFKFVDMMLDLQKRGWRAAPYVSVSPGILVRRYGEGLHTAIALMNATPINKVDKITFWGQDISGAIPLISGYGGQKCESIVQNNNAYIELALKRREYKVFEVVGDYTPSTQMRFKFNVSAEISRHSIVVKVENVSSLSADGKWRFPIKPEYRVKGIFINGKETQNIKKEKSFISCKTILYPNSILTIQYLSKIYKSPDYKLRDITYISNGVPSAEIIIPNHADEYTKLAAKYLSDYFWFWQKFAKGVTHPCHLPILRKPSGKRTVIILKVGQSKNVKVENKRIEISAPDSFSLSQLVWNTLYILDDKYRFYGKFHGGFPLWRDRRRFNYDKNTINMLKAVGLLGGILHLYQGKELSEIKRLSKTELYKIYKDYIPKKKDNN